jgi:hypothetical protein
VAWHAALLLGHVLAHHGDLSALVYVGANRADEAPFQAAIRATFPYGGSDGQYYYTLAQSPWSKHSAGLDYPGARQLRILYPALCWLTSGGDPHALLWAMPLLNLLALGALTWFGAEFARRQGLSPWLGLLLPLAVNAGMPALRNLTDVFAITAVCAALFFWLTDSPAGVVAASAAAVFSREQNLVLVAILFGAAVILRRFRLAAALGVVLAAWVAWALWLTYLYRTAPLLPAGENFTLPFRGLWHRWTHLEGPGGSRVHVLLHAGCLLWLTSCLGAAIWMACWRVSGVVRLMALAGAGLVACGGLAIYGDSWAYMRVFAWLPLALWLGCVEARRVWPLAFLAIPAVLPLLGVYQQWRGL